MKLKDKSSNKIANRIIFVCSIIGVLIAIYVTQSFVRQSPIVCVNNGCELVRKSIYSKLFGVPVPVFGLIGYSLLVIFSFMRTITDNKNYLLGMLFVSLFGVCFVAWFTFTEIFIIKAICTWCAISAINMLGIFLLTIKIFASNRRLTQS